jgi:hypothetical protein
LFAEISQEQIDQMQEKALEAKKSQKEKNSVIESLAVLYVYFSRARKRYFLLAKRISQAQRVAVTAS